MPTLVYSYGCKPPQGENFERVSKQLSLAHRYYNELIRIELDRRSETNELQRFHGPAVASAETEVNNCDFVLVQALSDLSKGKSSRLSPEGMKPLRLAVTACRAALKEAKARLRLARQELADDADYQAALEALHDRFADRRKALYNGTPDLFWGTKNAQAQSVEMAVSTSKGELRFRRWSRNGRLTCQVMGGASTADVMAGTDTRVQVERMDRSEVNRFGHVPSAKRVKVRIRIGSDPASVRIPVWAEVMAYLHRPLPEGGTVVSVQLVRRERPMHWSEGSNRFVERDEWSVQFTVKVPDREPECGEGVVAADTGWRRLESGVRAAHVRDEFGREESLILPNELLARWDKCRDLQSIRDRLFDEARANLVRWLSETVVPDWMRERCEHLPRWKSHRRLVQLVGYWGQNRFAGDESIFGTLRAWTLRETHLEQYEVHNRLKAEAIRLQAYRNFGSSLANRYRTLLIKDTDFARMRREKSPESVPEEPISIHWRNAAANGLLVDCLRKAFESRGGKVVELPQEETTATCHACGVVEAVDGVMRTHDCSSCGAVWDLDDNCCRNLLWQYTRERSGVDENSGPARGSEVGEYTEVATDGGQKGGRWGKRKANRSKMIEQVDAE